MTITRAKKKKKNSIALLGIFIDKSRVRQDFLSPNGIAEVTGLWPP